MPSSRDEIAKSLASEVWPQLDQVLDSRALSPVACAFVAAISAYEDLPERMANMALVFRRREQHRDAQRLAKAALALAPDDFRVRVLTEWTLRREAPLWHFNIIHDQARNEAYARALSHFVRPGMTVFEVGTGTGILAMLAARAGAEHVYTCERRIEVAEAARAIIARNGLADRITVIAKDVNALRLGVDLPRRADLFVAELVDNHLLGENVLAITEMARARFLTPEAVLLPQRIAAMACLVSGRGHRQNYRVETVMGFDLTPFNRFTPFELCAGRGGGEVEMLSEAVAIMAFDLNEDNPEQGKRRLELCADKAGLAEGVMRWLRLDFGAGIEFENKPPQDSSWYPVLHVLPEALSVMPGSIVPIEASHTRNRIFVMPAPKDPC